MIRQRRVIRVKPCQAYAVAIGFGILQIFFTLSHWGLGLVYAPVLIGLAWVGLALRSHALGVNPWVLIPYKTDPGSDDLSVRQWYHRRVSHELTHLHQQDKDGPVVWVARYLTPRGCLEYEAEAYAVTAFVRYQQEGYLPAGEYDPLELYIDWYAKKLHNPKVYPQVGWFFEERDAYWAIKSEVDKLEHASKAA